MLRCHRSIAETIWLLKDHSHFLTERHDIHILAVYIFPIQKDLTHHARTQNSYRSFD